MLRSEVLRVDITPSIVDVRSIGQGAMVDDLSELHRIEREARREQASAEAESLQLHLASRTLGDFCWEAMQGGAVLRVGWPGGKLVGDPLAAVRDLLVLKVDVGTAAVNLSVVSSITIVERRPEVATVGERDPGSFLAWCRMVESRSVRVQLVSGRTAEGTLTAVTPDHLLVATRSGDQSALAHASVAAVQVEGDPLFGV